MANYANITTSAQPNKDGGYKSTLYFVEVANVTTWQRPTGSPSAVGDKFKITAAHTWAASQGCYSWETKLGSVTHTTETQGDEGAKVAVHVVTCKVLGDDAATLEQMVQALNDQKVIFIKDADCAVADSFIQIGDDCNPVTVEFTFDGKDSLPTSTAQKEYTITFRSKKKFFYLAALDTTF